MASSTSIRIINAKLRYNKPERVRAENGNVIAPFGVECGQRFDGKSNLLGKNGVVVLYSLGQRINVFLRHRNEIAHETVGIEPHNFHVGDDNVFFSVQRILEYIRA